MISKALKFLKFFFSNLEFGLMGCVVKFKIGNILFSDSVGIWEIFEFGIEIFEVFFSNLEFGHMGCVVKFKIGNIIFPESVGILEIFEFVPHGYFSLIIVGVFFF